MNIWLISLFEQTQIDDNKDTRFNNIANIAEDRGHNVTFWTSTFRHNIKKQRFQETTTKRLSDNYKLIFVKSKPYKENISFQRIFSHGAIAKELVWEFNQTEEKPDIIFMAFPPVSSAEKVVNWANKHGIPVIIDIIDPWPDIFIAHFKKRIPKIILELAFIPLSVRVKSIFKQVNTVTAISNQYLEWAKSYNPQIENTNCFYPAVNFTKIKESIKAASIKVQKDESVLKVIYAGSLGFSYDIPTILKAAEVLENEFKEIEFIIAGDGPQKGIIEEYVKKHNNLTYLGRISKEELMQEYYKADLGLTQHIKGATQSVTYKLFDLLGAGLPILNSLESEMKDIILQNKVGLFNEPGDYSALAENIKYYYTNRDALKNAKEDALKLTKESGDAKVVYSSLVDMLEENVNK